MIHKNIFQGFIPRTSLQYDQINQRKHQNVTAQSWIIYNTKDKRVQRSLKMNKQRQIASLTKIMTCICSLQIIQYFKINFRQVLCHITTSVTQLGGTSAQLQAYYEITIKDLLYGMMLPSGNDAAQLLSQCLGYLIYNFDNWSYKNHQIIDISQKIKYFKVYNSAFLKYMNNKAFQFGMRNTHFDNVHGLSNKNNFSSAADICILSNICIQNKIFKTIISTEYYTAKMISKDLQIKQLLWQNTHKLIKKHGYQGIKTGQTRSAGPCLATWYKPSNLIIVVLNSEDQQCRFSDTQQLIKTVINIY